MQSKRLALFVTLALFLSTGSAFAANLAWPASTTAVDIGASLKTAVAAIEPSGLVWHSGRNQLMGVGDEGQVFAMNADGSGVTVWTVSGSDLEDITVVDPSSSTVYLADENGRIIKYNLSTSSVTQTWSVTDWMPELDCDGNVATSSTCGMEALTYANGYFYAGYQYTGKIFKLDLSGNTAVKLDEFTAHSATSTDISGLTYKDGYLYALYSSTLAVMDTQGNVKVTYSVPGSDQEGIAIGMDSNNDGDADIFIAHDTPAQVYDYDNFLIYGWVAPAPVPVVIDADNDGVEAASDCNDNDATVSAFATFYVDADYDGIGSTTTASLCSATAPYGYSTTSTDKYDTIPNAGVEVKDGIDNDGDSIVDEHNTVAWNGYHPYFSTLDANVSSRGKIIGYWGLKTGEIGVRYADWSVYRYQVFTKTGAIPKITAVSGTAYLTVTLGSSTVTLNGYNGVTR